MIVEYRSWIQDKGYSKDYNRKGKVINYQSGVVNGNIVVEAIIADLETRCIEQIPLHLIRVFGSLEY